jgi:DNA-binding PadR family transcriptional regulator
MTHSTGKQPKPDPASFLPLQPAVFHILLALGDGEKHGYAIKREIARRTDNTVRLGPATLYGSIKRMLAQQLIEESDERPDFSLDDERRRYYRITNLGQRVAAAEVERMKSLISLARLKRMTRAPESS